MKKKFLFSLVSISLLLLFMFFPRKKFDYVFVDIEDAKVECKYALFQEPLTVNRVDGLREHFENIDDLPQWARFAQYRAYKNDNVFDGFAKEFYTEHDPKNIALHENHYADRIKALREKAQTLADTLGDQDLSGKMKGLLFIRYNNLQIVLLRYNFSREGRPSSSGGFGVLSEGKLVFCDEKLLDEELNLLILKCMGAIDQNLIEKLRESDHGLLELKVNPLSWDLPAS